MSTFTLSTVRHNLNKIDLTGLSLPVLVLLIMAMLVVPMPPLLLDIMFTFNIACSLIVIMIAIGTRKPLEFSSFPSVLLITTMLRLALNVASTRVILVNGHEGHEAAGKVVAAFGEFVISGNYICHLDDHQLHRGDQGRGSGLGSQCPLHLGRHAWQADVH
jgi:flagellar biosynthesis protein FlhA